MKRLIATAGLLAAALATPAIPVQGVFIIGVPKAAQINVEEVIRKAAAAETQNKIARSKYAFTQDFKVQTIGVGGTVTGELHRVSDVSFDSSGKRVDKVTYFPASTLSGMTVTAEDLRDIAGVQAFVLTSDDLPKYHLDYKGKERLDDLNTYIFEVKPIQLGAGESYFQGRIWVDDTALQIVKAKGQAVSEAGDQRFPHFDSYRENIDGKYWFPTYVHADDVLNFRTGSIHMRMTVRFVKYHRAG
jgi:hypothetical protein